MQFPMRFSASKESIFRRPAYTKDKMMYRYQTDYHQKALDSSEWYDAHAYVYSYTHTCAIKYQHVIDYLSKWQSC